MNNIEVISEEEAERLNMNIKNNKNKNIYIKVESVDHELSNCENVSTTTTQKKSQACSGEIDVTQAWFTSKDDKDSRKGQGQNWKSGQWSKDEVKILEDNVMSYCVERSLSDPSSVIFHMQKEDRKDFYRYCAKGLDRPLFSVYRRLLRMYDKNNHVGKYSKEEVTKLKQLVEKYGKDWAKIGAEMKRSASSVKDKMRLLRESNSGKWFTDEEDRLVKAIQMLQGQTTGIEAVVGIEWPKVADIVGTRSEKQCRTKWLNYLSWKKSGGKEWSRDDDLKLLDTIENLNYQNDNDVDWTNIFQNWPSARSPQWLRAKWWSLKRHVKDYVNIKLPELVDKVRKQLHNRYNISQSTLASRLSAESNSNSDTPTVSILTGSSLIDNAVFLDSQSIILDQGSIVFDNSNMITSEEEDDDDGNNLKSNECDDSDIQNDQHCTVNQNDIILTQSGVQQYFFSPASLSLLSTTSNLRDHFVVQTLPITATTTSNHLQPIVFSTEATAHFASSVDLSDQQEFIDSDMVVSFSTDPIMTVEENNN